MANSLTSMTDVPFELCFKYKLEKEYNLIPLEKQDLKEFQHLLDLVCQLSVSEVTKKYERKDDKFDKYNGQQVHHFGCDGKAFRIHTILEAGTFKIIRIDPNHKIHQQ